MKKINFIFIFLLMTVLFYSSEEWRKIKLNAEKYYEEGHYSEAAEEFKKLIDDTKAEFTLIYIHKKIAYCYTHLNKYEDALKYFHAAYEINVSYKNDIKITLELTEQIGLLYIKNNDKIKGEDYLLKADKLNSKNYFVYYNLAVIYSGKNIKEKAVNYFNTCLYNIVSEYNTYNIYKRKYIYDFKKGRKFINGQIDYLKKDKNLNNIKDEKMFKDVITNKDSFINGIEKYFTAEEFLEKKDYENAKNYLKLSTEYFEKINADLLWLSDCYNKTANILKIENNYKEAVIYYLKINKIYTNILGVNHLYTALNYNTIAYYYQILAKYDLALDYYKKALFSLDNIENKHYSYIPAIYDNIGSIYSILNDYTMAIEYFLKSKKIYEENHNPDAAVTYNNLGLLYNKIGKYNEALHFFNESLKIFKYTKGEKHIDTAKIYNSIGMLYYDKGKYDNALENMFLSLDIIKQLTDKPNSAAAVVYNNIGLVYNSIGNPNEALKFYQKSLDIRKLIFNDLHPDIAESYNNIASVYENRNKYNEALECYFKSLKIYEKIFGEDHINLSLTYNNIGVLYTNNKLYEKALEYYFKVLDIYNKSYKDENLLTANVYNNIGGVFHKKNEYNKALEYYLTALNIRKKIYEKNHPDLITSYHNIADCYQDIGDYNKAAEFYMNAVDIIEKTRFTAGVYKDEKAGYFQSKLHTYYSFINCLYNLKNIKKAFHYCESTKSRSLLDEISMDVIHNSDEIDEKYLDKLKKLENRIKSYKKIISEKKSKNILYENEQIILNKFENQYKNLLNEIYKKYPKYLKISKGKILDIIEIQGNLNKNEIIIEYLITNKNTGYVFVISKNNYNMILLDKNLLINYKNYIEVFRQIITTQTGTYFYDKDAGEVFLEERGLKKNKNYRIINNNEEVFKIINKKLYDLLILPVEEYLINKDVIIIPDKELAYLPFEVLKDGNNNYLIENLNISYNKSASILVKTRNFKISSNIPILCFGGAKYSSDKENSIIKSDYKTDDEFKRQFSYYFNENKIKELYLYRGYKWCDLPATESEVKEIGRLYYKNKKLFNENILLGIDVTEEKIKKLNKNNTLSKYKIIHFAAHGHLDMEISELSAIILSQLEGKKEDGYLTLIEILNLNLNSELIMLSACDTGLGKIIKGEGVCGLAQSFIISGTKNICMTLWSIADESTKDFMISFYKKTKSGLSYKEALIVTKREFINHKKWNKPYFWAPFILYGE